MHDLWPFSAHRSRLHAESLSIPDGLRHARTISECALASPGVRKRRKCVDPESVLFTHPSVTERLPSLVVDTPQGLSDMFNICLQDDDVQDFDTSWGQILLGTSEMPPENVLEGFVPDYKVLNNFRHNWRCTAKN